MPGKMDAEHERMWDEAKEAAAKEGKPLPKDFGEDPAEKKKKKSELISKTYQ